MLLRHGSAAGTTISFNVGGGGSSGGNQSANVESALSPEEIARGTRAKDAHEARLMADPAVQGVGVGEDDLNPGRAAVVILVRRAAAAAGLARELDGVATKVIETDDIVAYGWNQPAGGSCKAVR